MTKKKDNNYYVYVHRKKTNGDVFYVGKGKGNRAWLTTTRSLLWNRTKDKYGYIVEIVQNNLQEWYAFELEKELICKYGRKDNKTGILVNMSDGGEGPSGQLISEAQRKKLSDRFTEAVKEKYSDMYVGNDDPTFKTVVCNCTNLFTGESFIGTRFDFYKKFKRRLKCSKDTRRHTQGWIVEGQLSDTEIQAILNNYGGKYSSITSGVIYSFTNINTGETINCKRHELESKFNVKVRSLFCNKVKRNVVKGWCLTDLLQEVGIERLTSKAGLFNSNADQNTYSFTNLMNGDNFLGTRIDFDNKYRIKIFPLFNGYTIHRDWIITGSDYKSRTDYVKYTFKHKDGQTFFGTKRCFNSTFGIAIHGLFREPPEQTVKGWSLLK
jgi:hypothetical protein